MNGVRRQLKNDNKIINMIKRHARQTLERKTGSTMETASFNKMVKNLEKAGKVIKKFREKEDKKSDKMKPTKDYVDGYILIEKTGAKWRQKMEKDEKRESDQMYGLHEHLLVVFTQAHRRMCEQAEKILDQYLKKYVCHGACGHASRTRMMEDYENMITSAKNASYTLEEMFKEMKEEFDKAHPIEEQDI